MKLAACDFCDPEGKQPKGNLLAVTIDQKSYDICKECKAALTEKLQSKGVAVHQVSLTEAMRGSWDYNNRGLPKRIPEFGDLTFLKQYTHDVRTADNGARYVDKKGVVDGEVKRIKGNTLTQ